MILLKRIPLIVGLAALTALSGCKNPNDNPVDSMRGMHAETQARLSTQAADAIAAGRTAEALELYARLHKEHPHDRSIALVYAQLLRKTGNPAEAVEVLSPFASFQTTNNDSEHVVVFNTDAVVLNELAAAHIATGNFGAADALLQRVIGDPGSEAMHPDAYSLMGIVQDARGQHKEAEQSFNKALERWKGDPTPVMNNLALCLAAQGEFDQALDTLRRALVISPNDKQEIARNIALITNLRGEIIAKPVMVVKVVKPVVKKTTHKKKAAACGPCPAPVPAKTDDKKQ